MRKRWRLRDDGDWEMVLFVAWIVAIVCGVRWLRRNLTREWESGPDLREHDR